MFKKISGTPSKRDGRTQIRDIMNLPKQQNIESTRFDEEINKLQEPEDLENSFDRAYNKRMDKLYEKQSNKSKVLSPRSKSFYDQIHSIRVEPKRLEFDEQYPEEDEVNLNYSRLEYQELPDEYSSEDNGVLHSDEMDSEGLFDDIHLKLPKSQVVSTTKEDQNVTLFSQSLQKRFEALKGLEHEEEVSEIDDILYSDEMDTDNLFVDDQIEQPKTRKFEAAMRKEDYRIPINESIQRRLAEVKSSKGQANDHKKDHSYLSDDEMDLADLIDESLKLVKNVYPEAYRILRDVNKIVEFDKELNKNESSSIDEHLQSYEIDELFRYEDEDEQPVPVRDIPIPTASTSTPQRRHINVLEKPGPRPQRTQIKPHLDSFNLVDESLPDELLQLTQESSDSILADHEMEIGDLFEANNVMAPKDVISPEKMAVLSSIAQSRKFKEIQQKLRIKRGEEPISEEAIETVHRIMEEDLMYPTSFKNVKEPKTLLDRSIEKNTLPGALIKSPQKLKYQPFAEYEKDADEHYNYVEKQNVSQPEHFQSFEINELFDYEDEGEDPVPIREIPFIQKTSTPQKPRFNYLGKLTPMRREEHYLSSERNIADESMPRELDESQEVLPSLSKSTNELQQNMVKSRTLKDLKNQMRERREETPLPEDEEEEPAPVIENENRLNVEELIAQISLIENLPAPQKVEILAEFEKDLDRYYNFDSLEEHLEQFEIDELIGYDDEMEEPLKLENIPVPKAARKQQRIDYLSKTQPLPAKEPKRIYVGSDSELEDESMNLTDSVISQQSLLNENEMNTSDMFGHQNQMDPRFFTSPKKMAIEMSKAQSNKIHQLKNRFREQKGESAIQAPQIQENIPDNEMFEKYQQKLEENEILNFKSTVQQGADVLKEFDRDLGKHYQNESKQEHLQSFEIDELAAYDEEDEEPLPLRQIPMKSPKQKTPSPQKRRIQKPPRYFDHPSDEDILNADEMEYLFGDEADEFARPVAVRNLPISLPKTFLKSITQKPKREYLSFLGEPKRIPLPIVTGDDDLDLEETPSFVDLIYDSQTAPAKYCRADKSFEFEESSISKDIPASIDLLGRNKTPIKYVQVRGPEILSLKNRLEKIKTRTPIKESSYSPIKSNEPIHVSTPITGFKKAKDYLKFKDEIGSPIKHLDFVSPPKNLERSFDDSTPLKRNVLRKLFSQSEILPEENKSNLDKLTERFKELAEASPANLGEQELNLDSDYSLEEIKQNKSTSGSNRPRTRTRARALYNLTDDEDNNEDDEELTELEYNQEGMDFAWLGEFRPRTPSPKKHKSMKKLEPRVAALTKRKDVEKMKKVSVKTSVPVKKNAPVKQKMIKKR